ncbi:hypothetical protein F4678DRAFT_481937 [Xylaria arbuscula]|nr:hypothetical protein F4678DRAFT_481937 [Xylaria arbuscula]
MKGNQLVATAIFSTSLASGRNVAKRCEKYSLDPCLLSFIWCDDTHSGGGCSLPSTAYPDKVGSTDLMPLLDPDVNYTIQWQTSQPSNPVTLLWSVGWQINVTGEEFIFNPAAILDSFPTELSPNTSSAQAWVNAGYQTSISLRRNYSSFFSDDSTQTFYVSPSEIFDMFLHTQRDLEYNKWEKGVGLGVGIGVPVLLIITGLATWYLCKRRMTKFEHKPVDMAPQ